MAAESEPAKGKRESGSEYLAGVDPEGKLNTFQERITIRFVQSIIQADPLSSSGMSWRAYLFKYAFYDSHLTIMDVIVLDQHRLMCEIHTFCSAVVMYL